MPIRPRKARRALCLGTEQIAVRSVSVVGGAVVDDVDAGAGVRQRSVSGSGKAVQPVVGVAGRAAGDEFFEGIELNRSRDAASRAGRERTAGGVGEFSVAVGEEPFACVVRRGVRAVPGEVPRGIPTVVVLRGAVVPGGESRSSLGTFESTRTRVTESDRPVIVRANAVGPSPCRISRAGGNATERCLHQKAHSYRQKGTFTRTSGLRAWIGQ